MRPPFSCALGGSGLLSGGDAAPGPLIRHILVKIGRQARNLVQATGGDRQDAPRERVAQRRPATAAETAIEPMWRLGRVAGDEITSRNPGERLDADIGVDARSSLATARTVAEAHHFRAPEQLEPNAAAAAASLDYQRASP